MLAALIGWSLFKAHAALDATERDRLRVQARVVDDNVGQQLDGMNRALASVSDDFLATPVYSVSTLISMRLKALSDAIPGVRSMVLLDVDGNVVASSVDTCSAATSPTATTSAPRAPAETRRRCTSPRRSRPRSARTPSSSRARSMPRTAPSSAPSPLRSSPSTSRC